MVSEQLLAILRCPDNQSALSLAETQLVAQLNSEIRARRLCNRAGVVVQRVIDGGLVRAEGDLLYPIIDQIPVLLHDEAIPLN